MSFLSQTKHKLFKTQNMRYFYNWKTVRHILFSKLNSWKQVVKGTPIWGPLDETEEEQNYEKLPTGLIYTEVLGWILLISFFDWR